MKGKLNKMVYAQIVKPFVSNKVVRQTQKGNN